MRTLEIKPSAEEKVPKRRPYSVTPSGRIRVDVECLVKDPEVQEIFKAARRIVEGHKKKLK